MNKKLFINLKTIKDASAFVSEQIISLVKSKPNCVLGLATGSTPVVMYQHLITNYQTKKTDYQQVVSFNLDEYLGLSLANMNQSYQHFMKEQLFSHININLKNTHFPDPHDPGAYDGDIANAGGIDLQILGIGTNGHIGFNEPPADLKSRTRVVNLVQSTIDSNARFFKNKNAVPKQAISMGLGSILLAKQIILMAFGKNKKRVLQQLLKLNKFNANLPASALIDHPNVLVVTDDEASPL